MPTNCSSNVHIFERDKCSTQSYFFLSIQLILVFCLWANFFRLIGQPFVFVHFLPMSVKIGPPNEALITIVAFIALLVRVRCYVILKRVVRFNLTRSEYRRWWKYIMNVIRAVKIITRSDVWDLRPLLHISHLKSNPLWTTLMCCSKALWLGENLSHWLHLIGFDSCFMDLCVAKMYLLVYHLLHTSHCNFGFTFFGVFGASECFVFWWYFSCCAVLKFLKESFINVRQEFIIWLIVLTFAQNSHI